VPEPADGYLPGDGDCGGVQQLGHAWPDEGGPEQGAVVEIDDEATESPAARARSATF
jgi:hypothetical protein